MIVSPVGLRVRITISDPWDFVTENGSFSAGRIISFRDTSAGHLPEFGIELDAPLIQKDLIVREVFARPRHLNDTFERVLSGDVATYNFSNVRGEDWGLQSPDARMGFIGDMRLEAQAHRVVSEA